DGGLFVRGNGWKIFELMVETVVFGRQTGVAGGGIRGSRLGSGGLRRQDGGRNNFLVFAWRLPGEPATGVAFIFEKFDLNIMLAFLQLDLTGLFVHAMETAIIDHLLAIQIQARAVVGFEKTLISAVSGRA